MNQNLQQAKDILVRPNDFERLREESELLTSMLDPKNHVYQALKSRMVEVGNENPVTRTTLWQWSKDYDPKTKKLVSWEGDHLFTTPPVLDAYSSDKILYAGKGFTLPIDRSNARVVTDTGYFWQTFFDHLNFLDYGIREIPSKIIAGEKMRTHSIYGATSVPVFQRLEKIAILWNIPIEKAC